jgi:putative membrane protein
MLSALASSGLFLAGYLVYHYVHGDTPYPAEAPLRGLYLAILLSHVVLSAIAFPMVLWTFSLALRGQLARHRRFAKWTYPLWLYVSVTGVVVFVMLRSAIG